MSESFWDNSPWHEIKLVIVGVGLSGLFLGATYFSYYLIWLYRLPRTSRQFRHQQHHLRFESLLRYVITIVCMFVLVAIIYWQFQIIRLPCHIGLTLWLLSLALDWLRKRQKSQIHKSNQVSKHTITEKTQ